jgi:hypothetical protein
MQNLDEFMVEYATEFLRERAVLDPSASTYLHDLTWPMDHGANHEDCLLALERLGWGHLQVSLVGVDEFRMVHGIRLRDIPAGQ